MVGAQLQNPLLSSIFSLASVVGSRLNGGERQRKFSEIACVIDFTTRTTADFKIIENDLSQLSAQLDEFRREGQQLFRTYGQVVDYQTPWATYKEDRARLPVDPLSNAIARSFSQIQTGAAAVSARQGVPTRPAMLVNARHQLREVEGLLDDYERLLDATEQFLVRYRDIVSAHTGATCSSIPNLGATLNELHTRAQGNIISFRTAYRQDIAARMLSILREGN